jgi:hypothetical protein
MDDDKGDQKRTMTAAQALAGSNYLVVGRPDHCRRQSARCGQSGLPPV